MRKQLAATLTLTAALAVLPWSSGSHHAGLATTRIDTASAAPQSVSAASRQQDANGIVKNGPLVTDLVSPTKVVGVPGYADIYLAGKGFPFKIPGKNGVDYAGRQDPVRISIKVKAGNTVTVTARYGVAHAVDVSAANDSNGLVRESIIAVPPILGMPKLGLSNIIAPLDSLVGVFTRNKPNTGKVPSALNFGTARARDAATLKPLLNQVFFIGTGVTSKGAVKRFTIPSGATNLYLGALNYAGSNHSGHGQIVASVTGAVLRPFQPVPSVTATAAPVGSIVVPTDTPIPQTGQLLPTDTVTDSPTPVSTAPTNGATATLVPGAPTNTPLPGAPTSTPVPGAPTASATLAPVNTPSIPTVPPTNIIPNTVTPTPTTVPTAITQVASEIWGQYQNSFGHSGYQTADYTNSITSGGAPDLDPNANPNSPFFAGKLHLQTKSPTINSNVQVAGGPVLAANNLYFTTQGLEADLRCVWANGSPGAGSFACPGGFTTVIAGASFEDNVPVVEATSNSVPVVYFLSHNGPSTLSGASGSITEYSATSGTKITNFSTGALPTAPGVALTKYLNTCYLPTYDSGATTQYLHFIDCSANGNGHDITTVALQGNPLAGAAVDAAGGANIVVVAEAAKTGNGGIVEAFDLSTGSLKWQATLSLGQLSGPFTPFQPIVAGNDIVVATNGGVFAFNAASTGTGILPIWSRVATTSSSSAVTSCQAGGGDVIPGGYSVGYTAEDTPAYDPFPTGYADPSIFVGLPVYINTTLTVKTLAAHELVRINLATGNICAVGSGTPSAVDSPVSGAPVTDTGAPSTTVASTKDPRDVVFYADNSGNVYALDANSLSPLVNTSNGAYPDQARPGIQGLTSNSPPIGASLIVANGHLYFGTSVGAIVNYSF